MTDKIVVFVTCGSAAEARRIGRTLVERKAAACVSIFQSPVQSIYRWKGTVKTAEEHVVMIKTSRKQFTVLQKTVQSLHSYDVPRNHRAADCERLAGVSCLGIGIGALLKEVGIRQIK